MNFDELKAYTLSLFERPKVEINPNRMEFFNKSTSIRTTVNLSGKWIDLTALHNGVWHYITSMENVTK